MKSERWGSPAGCPSLLRAKHVAWIVQLDRTPVEEMIREKVLPIGELDGALRVPRRQLFAWVDALCERAKRSGEDRTEMETD